MIDTILSCHHLEPARPYLGVRLRRRLSLHLYFTVSQSAPDLSLIFSESLEYLYWAIFVNRILESVVFVRYSRNWSVSNLEGAEPQIWENLYI